MRGMQLHYGPVRALDGVDLDVAEGEVHALLGENGAGKTTTVEILEGHRERSGGSVRVLGIDPGTAGRDYRDRIGVVLQSAGIETEFTVAAMVDRHADLYEKRHDLSANPDKQFGS